MSIQNISMCLCALLLPVSTASQSFAQSIWVNPAGGNWSDPTNWDPMVAPNGSSASASLLNLAFPYTVELNQLTLLDALEIESGATLSINSNQDLRVGSGGLHNVGRILIGGSGSNFTALTFVDDASITGSGTIDFAAVGSPRYAGIFVEAFGNTLTIGPGQTVTGTGNLRSPANTDSPIIFNGTANANRDGLDLLVSGDIDATGGGVFMGTNGGTVTIDGHLKGGTLLGGVFGINQGIFDGALSIDGNGVRKGTARSIGNGLINEGQFSILNGGNLLLSGAQALINNGVVSVNEDISGLSSRIDIIDDAIIDGNGVIDLAGSASVEQAGIRITNTPSGTLTIGPGQTITGTGYVYAESTGSRIVLNGTINADRKGERLYARGLIDASGGGVLVGTNGGTVAMGGDLIEGIIAGNVYGVLPASYSGTVAMGTNGVAVGAFATVCLGNGLTNLGDFEVGSDLELRGQTALRNHGTVALNDGRLLAGIDAEIHGTGMIELNSTGQTGSVGIFVTQTDTTLTIHEGQTITGTGEFRGNSSDSSLVVLGSIAPGGVNNEIRMLGDIEFGSTTTLKLDIGGLDIPHFDRLTGESILNLDGRLELELTDGYQPNAGDRFTIIRANQINGSFSQVISPTIGIQRFYLVQTTHTIDAVWTCRTDFTGDGILDVFDVFSFIDAFMAANPLTDFTDDGIYDIFDVFAFLKEYKTGCP